MSDIFGKFNETFGTLLDKGVEVFQSQNDYKIAQARIQADTQPVETVVVTAPSETAPVTDTKRNTLILAGAGVASVALIALLVSVARR